MTDKELQHLSRVELIEIIYELQKQKDAADVRMAQLQEKLNDASLGDAEKLELLGQIQSLQQKHD